MPTPRIRRDDIRREIERMQDAGGRFPGFRILTEQVPDDIPDPDRPLIDPSGS